MTPRLAVLVDAENTSHRNWPDIRAQIAKLGSTAICRVFGNLADEKYAKWASLAEEEGLQPVMQFAGSNAADIAIAVAAMDLLYGSKIEGICLVTSDGDFTPLVHRLRSAGLKVYGIGRDKSATSLKKACTDFIVVSGAKVATVKKAA